MLVHLSTLENRKLIAILGDEHPITFRKGRAIIRQILRDRGVSDAETKRLVKDRVERRQQTRQPMDIFNAMLYPPGANHVPQHLMPELWELEKLREKRELDNVKLLLVSMGYSGVSADALLQDSAAYPEATHEFQTVDMVCQFTQSRPRAVPYILSERCRRGVSRFLVRSDEPRTYSYTCPWCECEVVFVFYPAGTIPLDVFESLQAAGRRQASKTGIFISTLILIGVLIGFFRDVLPVAFLWVVWVALILLLIIIGMGAYWLIEHWWNLKDFERMDWQERRMGDAIGIIHSRDTPALHHPEVKDSFVFGIDEENPYLWVPDRLG